jgi:fibronectin-binding autotransporter adhesin
LFALRTPAAAQTTYTWNGGGANGNWSTAANWGGTAPVSSLTDTIIALAGATNTSTTIDASYGATLQIRGLSFAAGASPFTVASAGPVLEIGADGITGLGGTSNHTISAPIRLGANQTWSLAGTNGRIIASGPVDLGSRTLTFGATGATWFVEVQGVVSGTGQLVVRGRTVLQAANTYSGGTLIDGGFGLQIASAASLGTGLVDLKGNSFITVTAAGDTTIVGGLAVNNVASNDINRLQVNNAQATIRLPAGGLSGSGTFSREGTGTFILTGANPFSGTLVTGTGGRMELIDAGGGASMNASSYSIFASVFRVGPGAVLLNNRPVIVDLDGRIEFEQSQTLSGISVGQSTSPISPNTALIAPNVTLTVNGGINTSYGTLTANITGFLVSGFNKTTAGTLVMSGNSNFTGQTTISAGVLSIDTIANAGSPSAIGSSNALAMGANSTLRYTGASAATDRTLTISSTVAQPATIEVTDAATVLIWNAPVNIGNNRGFTKAGAGTLLLTTPSGTTLGTTTVSGGTLTVTGTGALSTASTTVQTGATLSGRLTSAGANLNLNGGVTINAGGTLRAGTGGSADVFGMGSATFAAGSTFIVTATGGAAPAASLLATEGGGAASVNFLTVAGNPITLRIEKGEGDEFLPGVPITLEIVNTNLQTGGLFPNLVRRQFGAFVFNANEWNFQTIGFDIVPGSASLITDPDQTTLSVQFTPVPEPTSILALTAASGLIAAARRRMTRHVK